MRPWVEMQAEVCFDLAQVEEIRSLMPGFFGDDNVAAGPCFFDGQLSDAGLGSSWLAQTVIDLPINV